MLTTIAILDEVLAAHRAVLGADFEAYRNHTYRVVNLCAVQRPLRPEQLDKVAIAAAFHDLGIWTDRTFDYLAPSIAAATAYLDATGRSAWIAEVAAMIAGHHKIFAARPEAGPLVEVFRRADWIDVTRGIRSFGVARRDVRTIFAGWPSAGFHKRLVQLELTRLRTHPWNPLPMVRL